MPSSGASGDDGGTDATASSGSPPPPPASSLVWTNRYGNARTGAQTAETILTQANVSGGKFGLLFSRMVEGTIQAQPLYVPALTIAGKMHNVVIVATHHDLVYAFDADDPSAATPLWKQSLGTAVPFAASSALACHDLQPEAGIASTPVIDTSAGADPTTWTLYVEAKTFEGATFHHRVHALDLTTGMERAGSPVEISGAVAGTGEGSAGGMITFDPEHQMNRPGLLLDNGVLYIAFASHCDSGTYHGWVFAYDAKTLTKKAIFNTTPSGTRGGIWQSGMGMSADGKGGVYFVAGNSAHNTPIPYAPGNYGLSAVRLTLGASGLTVSDFWTESNFSTLNMGDYDLTSTAVLDLDSNLAFVGGKDARIHVLDRTNMGKYTAGMDADKIVQTVNVTVMYNITYKSGHMHGSPAYWKGPTGYHLFVYPEQSPLQDYAVTPTATMPVNPKPVMNGGFIPPHPGGMVTVSSNGTMAGTGVLWVGLVTNPMADVWHMFANGTLAAYNAEDISKAPLWTSDQAPMGRDALGTFAKFCTPVVANGKVYIGTARQTVTDPNGMPTLNALRVYGLMQ
jgi:hypothetical protein